MVLVMSDMGLSARVGSGVWVVLELTLAVWVSFN